MGILLLLLSRKLPFLSFFLSPEWVVRLVGGFGDGVFEVGSLLMREIRGIRRGLGRIEG